MPAEFTDADLQVVLGLQSPWKQVFADRHGRERIPHGQMKLLCSNLLGLALVEQHLQREEKQGRQRAIELVVAGASPGTHMLVLLEHLQPWIAKRDVRMTLYDPQPLDEALLRKTRAKHSNISFKQRVFTDADARGWSGSANCVVFFSDIRSRIEEKTKHMHQDEVKIAHDMQAQERWVGMMQPDYCMLKFHAPHATKDNAQVPASFAYLKGVPYEQGYAGLFSAEYRLFCTKADIGTQHEYSTADIEGHAFFHTRYTRVRTYSVGDKCMRYDDAFAAHVAHKAARLLGFDAQQLLHDAHTELHVVPMHFDWPHEKPSRVHALLARMLEIL